MSDTESIIRAIKLARIGGQDRWPFSDDDIEEIISALQLKADLETILDCENVSSCDIYPYRFFLDRNWRAGFNRLADHSGETLTEAIHLAAQAIRKGGE